MSNKRWKEVNDIKGPKSKVRQAYDHFISKGYSPAQASGIVGNLVQESTINLDSSIENGIGAYGIAQWLGPRRKALEAFAKERGTAVDDFNLQLEFVTHELNTTESRANRALLGSVTPDEAAAIFVNNYERSGERPGDKGYDNRINNATKFYSDFNVGVKPSAIASNTTIGSTVSNLATVEGVNPIGDLATNINIIPQEEKPVIQDEVQDEVDEAKLAIQQKINERNFLLDLASNLDIPFIERKKSSIPTEARF